jgi:hypothetical protein
MRFLWLAALAFVVIVAVLVAIGFARRVPLRKRSKLPRDPGMPRKAQGAPYRD